MFDCVLNSSLNSAKKKNQGESNNTNTKRVTLDDNKDVIQLADANIQIPVIHDDPIDKNEMLMMVMLVVVLENYFNVEDNPLMTCFLQATDKEK